MAHDLSTMMRLQLAGHGLALDEPRAAFPGRCAKCGNTPCLCQKPINRAAIREALIRRGVTDERDLAWLTASCPSLQDAERFEIPGASIPVRLPGH